VDEEERDEPSGPEEPAEVAVIDVSRWFIDRREVCLELDGVRYRLRLTRRNKLILQK
jgi:hemin uptake protein HemP